MGYDHWIKVAMNNKIAPSEDVVHQEREEVVGIEEVHDITIDMNENSCCHYFVEKEGEWNEHIVNVIISEEDRGSAITLILIVPRHTFVNNTKKDNTNANNWLLMAMDHDKWWIHVCNSGEGRHKAQAENERSRKKE